MSRQPRRRSQQKRSTFRITFKGVRDSLLFLAGLSGVVYETLVTQGERPTLLLLFGAMMGVAPARRIDEARRK